MPKNNDLKGKKFPMPIGFNKPHFTEFKNAMRAIRVKLISAPSMQELRDYCVPFANATWADHPLQVSSKLTNEEADLTLHHIFNYKILPSTMETIRCNFSIEGINLIDVTHILRYRRAVFSAECSGDKWINNKAALVPTSVENTPEFLKRYIEIVEASKKLYTDMIDSKLITLQDARTILPRNIETFYFMSMSLKDALIFINDRIDKQIQPVSDNIMAYKMIVQLLKQYPILVKTLSLKFLHKPASFYANTARQTRSTNWYKPDEDSDIFEWNENDFVYGDKNRDDINGLNGNDPGNRIFEQILLGTENYIKKTDKMVDDIYGKGFFDQDLEYHCK